MFAASKTASVSGGYQISRSLRFNSADSPYLNRTVSSTSNRQTYTFSMWFKIGALSTTRILYGANIDANNEFVIYLVPGNNLTIYDYQSGYNLNLVTTQVFRDTSAWYHLVVAIDTTQATASNRAKVYINGSQITAFGTATYPSQNYNTLVDYSSTTYNRIGTLQSYLNSFDGYLTEFNFIDGQALTPSSFGETNAQTGVWQPKAYSGSYGTNGFYLNFSDNSNTTAATLGKDYSGNGNNWTPNNFSVSAGAGNDSLVDSPTSYGTDTGAGGTVRGNYCTWNPLSIYGSDTFANGNLDATIPGGTFNLIVGTVAVTSGKWYWEVTASSSLQEMIGVSDATAAISNASWRSVNGWSYYNDGTKYTNTTGTAYGASFTTGDVIGVALDMDAGTLVFYKNGTSQGTAYSVFAGKTICPSIGQGSSGTTINVTTNFGQRPFAYTAPSGYKALCTQNLPTPTIGATTATLANKYFDINLWTGNGTSQTLTNSGGFQPDWVWTKGRSNADSNVVVNAVTGANQFLVTESTQAEATSSALVSAFTSSGFSIGSSTSINRSSSTYVGWQWKANGSGSSNTAGSITSTVSANTTSGFSVVTWSGNGASSATIGHGLGVAPSMIIAKERNFAGNWFVYTTTTGNTQYLSLNTTSASTTYTPMWNSTTPTSSVFTTAYLKDTGVNYVAYCFAEVAGYSKFGSYTGNGSTNGPFVYCGFRPAYVMIRVSSAASQWIVFDAVRNTYNAEDNILYPNTSGAENQGVGTSPLGVDFLSNGFKIRTTDAWVNYGNETIIFAAFATAPFKYSLAR